MKKLIIAMLFVLGAHFAQSQTINGVEIKELQQEYVQIVGQSKFMSTKLNISIDVGQHVKVFGNSKQVRIMDKNDKPLTLNSMIDALNFMNSAGYEYLDAYVVTIGSGSGAQNVYHYTLKKKQ